MSVIVAGTVRVPPENIETFRPAMRAMVEASRAEDGCHAYSYAEDVLEPGLIHVFEHWADKATLQRHFAEPHMAVWRAQWPAFGVSDRRLMLFHSDAQEPM